MIKTGQYVVVHMTTDVSAGNRLHSMGGSDAGARTGITTTLFKGVKVVAMNRGGASSALQGSGTSHNVTLEPDERQALYMLLAQQKGQIALTYNPAGAEPGGVNVCDRLPAGCPFFRCSRKESTMPKIATPSPGRS